MVESLSSLTLSDLLSRLHLSIQDLISRLDTTIKANSIVQQSELSELRNYITNRLNRGEEVVENKKLLAVMNLLSMNEGVIEFIKEEAEEWLLFVDAVESRISEGGAGVSKAERKELEGIGSAIDTIRSELRK